jgi:hypothetical protein
MFFITIKCNSNHQEIYLRRMKMGKKLTAVTICVILLFSLLAACGNGNGGGAGDLSFMWLVPNRLLYETEDRFVRDEDLQILVAEDGAVKEIPPASSSVLIEMIGNPGLSSEYISVVGSHFPFSMPGSDIVHVTYAGNSARYSPEVRGTFAGGGDGTEFVDIIWL